MTRYASKYERFLVVAALRSGNTAAFALPRKIPYVVIQSASRRATHFNYRLSEYDRSFLSRFGYHLVHHGGTWLLRDCHQLQKMVELKSNLGWTNVAYLLRLHIAEFPS